MVEMRPITSQDAGDTRATLLRKLGGRAHQVRAAMRAADHFVTLGIREDRDTGAWLMSAATAIANDIATEMDGIARTLRQSGSDGDSAAAVQSLRVRAHQLHAAARAADHFLELDSADEIDTANWLIAFARGLADKLAAELDDAVGRQMRLPGRAAAEDHDASLQRQLKAAVALPVGGD